VFERHAAARPLAGVQPRASAGTERSVADRERLRQHLICSGLLELAGLAYAVAYFAYGLHGFAWIVVGCMAIGAVAPVFALRGDLATSAQFATGSLFLVIVTTSYGSGGITQAGYAWIYLVPLIAGLLGGVRCLALWGPLALLATLTMSYGGIGPFRVSMAIPEAFMETQSGFDIVLIFLTVGLIVGTFLRTRTLAERETQTMVADLERAEGEARQADQAKSAFLATMSHEIRTPMNGVLGMTDLLLEMPLGEQQRRFVEVIKTSGESLLSILNDILDYSKIEAGRMDLESTPFDLRGLVEQAVELIAARGQEQRLVFIVDVDPGVPMHVVGDPTRLRQVLMNLLGNAVKFTSKGEVEVSVTVRARTPETVALTIAVRDTGVGIAPDAIERLFKPFSQADASVARQYGGTGLGLAISARIVALMGGRIGVDSTLGFGSTFRLELELSCPAHVAPPPPLAGRRVLLVDPHARRREALVRHLTAAGADVVACGGAPAARAATAADRASQPFDAALVVRDTAGDGLRLASAIAGAHPATRVVVLVEWGAFVDDETLGRLRLSGQVALPGTSNALIAAIGEPRPMVAATREAAAADAPLILVVDDNVINRRVAHHQLARLGYRVIEAENGRDALTRAAAAGPDAILMDIEMPVMDGYEATRRLRDAERGTARVPVIALTAHAIAGYRERVVRAGMDDYLTKPLRREELDATLRRLLRPPGDVPSQPALAV
jgi:signal transduction histidine kinase/DNA-binding response OmpR family regulator